MPINVTIRPSTSPEGGKSHVVAGRGAIDTASEAKRTLRHFPSQQPDRYVAVVGSTTYTYAQLIRLTDSPAAVTIRGSMPTVGPIKVTIPGDPLGSSRALPLKGTARARVSSDAHGQRFQVDIRRDGGVSFRTTGPAQPNTLDLSAMVGKDLGLQMRSVTRASGIKLDIHPGTSTIEFGLNDFSLLSQIASGHILIASQKYNLTGMDTTADIPAITVRLNPQTRVLELSLTAPQWNDMPLPPSVAHRNALKLIDPSLSSETQRVHPKVTREFLVWNRKQWKAYRQAMQNSKRRHMLVLSEQSTALPGQLYPPGRGPVYINLDPKRKNRTQTFRVTIPKGQDLQQGVSRLLIKAFPSLDMRRLYPNPPLPNKVPAESIVYNRGQDTLFFLDPNDSELAGRIARAFDIKPNEATSMVANGRIDMDFIVKNTPHMPENAVRGLVRAFFDTKHPGAKNVSNLGHRLFLALGDIRANLQTLVGYKSTYWNTQARTTRTRSFPVSNDESAFRGRMPANTDGINMTMHGYLPQRPNQVFPLLSGMQSQRYWMPWVTHSKRESDGTFTGRIDGKHNYHVKGQGSAYGPVLAYSYAPVSKSTKGNDFNVYSGRYLVVPAVDPKNPKRVVGSFVIQQSQIDFPGKDVDVYRGRDEALTPATDPTNFIFNEGTIARLGASLTRINNPNEDIVDVARYRMNRGLSNLYAIMRSGRSAAQVNPNRKAADAMSLSYVPGGNADTSRPHEFMAYAVASTSGTRKTPAGITLDLRPNQKKHVTQLMIDQLGVDQAWAEKRIQAKRIEIADLAALPWLKALMDEKTVRSFSQLILKDMNPQFVSRGERLLIHLGDLRNNAAAWKQGHVDFRNFGTNNSRFHVWSEHNASVTDSTDSAMYAIYPHDKQAPLDQLLKTFHHPEDFDVYDSHAFPAAASAKCGPITNPPWKDVSCTNIKLNVDGVGKIDYQIAHPTKIQMIGSVGHAPWTWVNRPDISSQGMEENEGDWILVPLKNKQGTLVMRIGLLNTSLSGDLNAAKTAFSRVPAFLSGVHQATRRRVSGNKSLKGHSFKFRKVFDTK